MIVNGKLLDHVRFDHLYDADGAYDGFAAGAATASIDMKGYDGCLILAFGLDVTASGGNNLSGLIVESNSAADGSGTD
ncbi:hypothetical protein LCGC14_2506510, partial [marine sediment metagenome]